MTRLRIAVAAAVALLIATAVGAAWAWRALHEPLALPQSGLMYTVQSGAALSTVMNELAAAGATGHPQLISWYSRIRGSATRIHAGEYLLEPGLTGITLLEKLSRGDVFLHQFTIVEGWRLEDLLGALKSHPAVVAHDRDAAGIMAELGEPDTPAEGQFLPDTYSFPKGTTDLEILRWAHAALVARLDAAWAARAPDTVLKDPYEALILASIIEKETARDDERNRIAGVFVRRLLNGMRLQTDPTVIYGLGAAYDGDIRKRDLEADTPYNTYTRSGLPPTPIALPGRASLEAAAQPAPGDELYFVADGNGRHTFSATLEEHIQAVDRMLGRTP